MNPGTRKLPDEAFSYSSAKMLPRRLMKLHLASFFVMLIALSMPQPPYSCLADLRRGPPSVEHDQTQSRYRVIGSYITNYNAEIRTKQEVTDLEEPAWQNYAPRA